MKNTNDETKAHEDMEVDFKEDYLSDLEIHDNYIVDFDAYEAMLVGQVYDSVSKSVNKSSITDSYAATLAIERAARVMGKLPDGETKAAGKKDMGKAAFLDILRQKWVYPNANAQRPFFDKLRLWQLYSSVYGYMPMFYDWNISSTGYVGPDCWLWNPRNLIPQQGRVSIADMDYVTALSWVGEKTIDSWIEDTEGGWDKEALKHLKDLVEHETKSADSLRDTQVERTRNPSNVKKGICIATRYEAGDDGHWVVFAPEHGYTKLRDIPNPHKNGRIPFVIKYSQSLYDSFYGMGDFQRAKPLQFARDGLTNFYFQGIKMNLLPPIIANANGVMKHTLDLSKPMPVIMETIPNSVRRMETSTAGLSTYQAAQSQLTGSLLSQFGTQNASIPGADALNPSQGKTPGAINMYQDKEATRDGQERTNLEQAIEELQDGFNSMIANISTEDIPINIFSDDIEDLQQQGYDDILEMIEQSPTGDSGTLVIKAGSLKNVESRFNIQPGSTAEISQKAQRDELDTFIGSMAKLQNIIKDDPAVQINWGAMVKSMQSLTNIKGVDEFVIVKSPEQLQQEQQQQMQMQAQAQATEQLKAQTEAQAQLAPASTSIRGNIFRNPDLAAVGHEINNMQ